ncbi:MAG TPA: hypothetical protein GXX25_06325 [Desulfotomaculum sp.]|nr:hypothetical protein [Desulfotomaculum sp.]
MGCIAVKVAIAKWENSISPLFDVSRELLVAEVERGQVITRRLVRFVEGDWFSRIEQVVNQGVETLICGGISDFYYRHLLARGIRVIPWVTGEVEEVLQAFGQNELSGKKFAMPGSGRWRRRCRRGW